MIKKYIVTLTEDERARLQAIIDKRSAKSVIVKRAYVLLAADTMGAAMNDTQIAESYRLSVRTIERLRQRFIDEGIEIALNGKKRTRFKPKTFDGKVEAHLIALRCSTPPEGYEHWSFRMLADHMVALKHVEGMSHESARQILKKTRSNRGPSNRG